MRRPVVGRKSRAVHAKDHRQILQRHVVNDAIVGPLQKSRVNRNHGMESHRGHAGGEKDGVLLGDADIVIPARHGFFQRLQPGAARHGGGDADDRIVLLAQLDHRLAENILVIGRCARLGRGRVARNGIVRPEAVEFLRMIQGGLVTFAFLGQNVKHHRHVAGLGIFQRTDEQRQIVSVNRPQITQSHFLENQAAAVAAAPVGFHLLRVLFHGDFGKGALEGLLRFVAQPDGQRCLWACV